MIDEIAFAIKITLQITTKSKVYIIERLENNNPYIDIIGICEQKNQLLKILYNLNKYLIDDGDFYITQSAMNGNIQICEYKLKPRRELFKLEK